MGHYWFAFDIGAYEDSTAHLTMLQDGAYNRLIRQYYKTSKPIPLDENQIIRVSGAFSEEEIAAVSFVLKEFFFEKADGWHNKRADAELTKRRHISKVRQSAADVKNRRLRTRRMQDANAIGKHTDDEWHELVRMCGNKCVRCGSSEQVTRDHIVPVYKGGSNHISNIQPLCQSCNSSKGPETTDFRPTAIAQQMQSKLVTEEEQLIPQLQLQLQIHKELKIKSTVHFVHPSIQEVTAYCQQRANRIDPQQWMDHYSANGWKVGRNSMKDWRAAVRTWEKNGHGTNGLDHQKQSAPSKAVSRWHNNSAELGDSSRDDLVAALAQAAGADQTSRLSAGSARVLEGEIKKLH